mgnify:CR=1 FL=1
MSKKYLFFGILGYFVQASILSFIVWFLIVMGCFAATAEDCKGFELIVFGSWAIFYLYAVWFSFRFYKIFKQSKVTQVKIPSMRLIWYGSLVIIVGAVLGFLYLPKFF